MNFVAPGVAIHTPAGSFDNLVPQQRSPNVAEHAPTIIDKINADLRDINVSLAAAREGMNDPEHPESVRAHFKRLHDQFSHAKEQLLAITAEWRKSVNTVETPVERIARLDEHHFTWSTERVALLKKLRAEGKGANSIGAALGCSRHVARGMMVKLGLAGRKPPKQPASEQSAEQPAQAAE